MEKDIQELQKPITDLRYKFIKLTEPHREALWRYCYKVTGNALDAEDLVQDTLLRAFAKLGYLGQALNPKAYLFKMATNLWIRQQSKKQIQVSDPERIEGAIEQKEPPFELGEVMEWLVELLPPRQRVAFLLASSFDFTAREIAELMSTTEGTVKSYIHRARVTIADKVGKQQPVNRKTVILGQTDDPILQQYIQAFNAGDVDGLLSLIDEQATTKIVGDWEEYGKEQIRKNSLHYWSLEKIEREAVYGLLEGTPVVFGLRKNKEGERALREILRLAHDNSCIQKMDWYYFSVDLIKHAARQLDMPYIVEGYQFEAQDATSS